MAFLLGAALVFLLPFMALLVRSRRKASRLEEELRVARAWCRGYERCLGLPMWSEDEKEKAIWARAAADPDDGAWEILGAINEDEKKLPFGI